jgi:nicotinamidase/pyrazinamidase
MDRNLSDAVLGLSKRSTRVVIVDPQRDFTLQYNGSLGILGTESDSGYTERVIAATRYLKHHGFIILATKDWHPEDHTSFASQHPGRKPFETITLSHDLPDGTKRTYEQILWPDHCVQGSEGANFFLPENLIDQFFVKGTRPEFDSYSGIKDDGDFETELSAYLDHNTQVKTLIIYGLATDYCVQATVMDAVAKGLNVVLIKNLISAVDLKSGEKAIRAMESTGKVTICESVYS